MTPVTLSIIVPTIARPTLAATLASIRDAGARAGDEVIVVADVDSPEEGAMVQEMLERAVWGGLSTGGKLIAPAVKLGFWGHAARNMAMREAGGTHVVTIDDDDVYEPGAIDVIRAYCETAPDAMHVWRMVTRSGGVVWTDDQIRQGNIGTPMMAVPREKAGVWGLRYEGDFDYAVDSAVRAGRVQWHTDVLVRCG